MKVSYEIKGVRAVKNQIKRFGDSAENAQKKSILESVLLIHETSVKLINDNSDGTDVNRSHPTRTVKASYPGDPPNTDKGRLVQSIKFDFKKGGLVGRVGTNLKYGAWLELGTAKMEPRPWLSTAVEEVKLAMGDIFEYNMLTAIKEVEK